MSTTRTTNFAFLKEHDEQLVRLGMLAEKYFTEDPNSSLLKLRQFAELLAQLAATRAGVYTSPQESQIELIRRLEDLGILPDEVAQLFHQVRRAGNEANHALTGTHRQALGGLKYAWQLGLWFHRTFARPDFRSGPFIPPAAPRDESAELRSELESLAAALEQHQAENNEKAQQLEAAEARLKVVSEEQSYWEELAVEAEQARVQLEKKLLAQQAAAAAAPRGLVGTIAKAAGRAAKSVHLDEADTRKLIDSQLREIGWEADSGTLTHKKGARPAKGVYQAIAEWPTASGPADYILFAGLVPVAVVEAKRKNIDVSSALQQAQRYSSDITITSEMAFPGGPWETYKIPFAFSSNGRPYLRQITTKSGIWFRDLRRADNIARPLEAWYSPEGLVDLLKRDEIKAHERLAHEPFDYGFSVRYYQQDAIRAIESGIAEGRRNMLVAMATGTGKTKTCIALIYRLLKVQRFRRVLFLVDRSALGEQAANAFKDTRMENLQTFADIFGIKELGDQTPDTDTMVHVATVQGMVHRLLYPAETAALLPVDQYDCIVVDECHRGYLLDRELAELELGFRSFDDYISKYRRVLDYFDAVKIGLTATPALHTTEIFGKPIYTYGYRDAVIDGFLVDHDPPFRIKTKLSSDGIRWQVGEEVKVYDTAKGGLDLVTMPDAVTIEVDGFNRKVITESFNRVVCKVLAGEIDPASRQKTLVFCVDDAHADLVVTLLKQQFQEAYGSVDDDAVVKITGSVDKPLEMIRRYKNEHNPTVAVTVDLLTTGIDVPEICNVVFLRRVNSRILYEQMLGRATRLCPKVEKEVFHIYDAVQIYDAMKDVTAMKPVVVNPDISFKQLTEELATLTGDEERDFVREQFIARLQRKKRHMSEQSARDFETVAGSTPDAFIARLQEMSLADVASWFTGNPALGEILDRTGDRKGVPKLISDHVDELLSVDRGYGDADRPEDYLKAFTTWIQSNSNSIPALITVLTRPRELTRKQLRELVLQLDSAGFSEARLATAWREKTNEDIAARIVGYIRQAAIGDALVPYEQRVNDALQKILSSGQWSTQQRDWLKKIAAQTKANMVVDRDAFDDPDLIFKRDGGGYLRLNRIFDGKLDEVLERFNGALWAA